MSAATEIHDMAVVERGAKLGVGVRVGPFCHIGPNAVLGDDVWLASHVSITGHTSVGARTRVFPHASLGGAPQDLKNRSPDTTLSIGEDCVLREGFTAHVGTDHGGGRTSIGNGCFLMASSHVAHDCHLGSSVFLANGSVMGGHCELADGVIVSGLVAIHQFVRIGRGAMIGGGAMVAGDVIPYAMAQGDRARLRGLNVIGLRRAGASRSEIVNLRKAYGILFDRARPLADNVELVRAAFPADQRVAEILDFVVSRDKRIFVVPDPRQTGETQDDI
jgi:UDP-N-acetylglucosamine acyltransferase